MMKNRKNLLYFCSLGVFIGVSACGAPDAPPAPPLPVMAANSSNLSVNDVVALQNIHAQSVLLQAIAGLAAAHSESNVIHAYAVDIVKSYKAQQEGAEKIAKEAHLILEKTLDVRNQAVLDEFKKRYKKIFDRAFLNFLSHPLFKGFVQQLEDAKRNAKDDALKALSKKDSEIYEQYQQQAQQIKSSGY